MVRNYNTPNTDVPRAHLISNGDLGSILLFGSFLAWAGYDRITLSAVADESLRRGPDGKIHLVRVHGGVGPDGRWHVRSTGAQGSHQLAASAAANGLAVVPDGDGIPAGGDVTVMLLIP